MLTAAQCEVVAFIGDGFIVCPECARDRVGRDEEGECFEIAKAEAGYDNDSGLELVYGTLSPIIEYTASTEFEEGLWCEDCGTEIVEPTMIEVTWTVTTTCPAGLQDDLDWELRHELRSGGYNISDPEWDYV